MEQADSLNVFFDAMSPFEMNLKICLNLYTTVQLLFSIHRSSSILKMIYLKFLRF